jgi:ADP-ribosylation factor-like protein 5B
MRRTKLDVENQCTSNSFPSSFSLFLSAPTPSLLPNQVGLDNAGKTSILYRLHLGETVSTTPTLGCNVERVVAPTRSSSTDGTSSSSTSSGLEFEVWDLGGQANLRPSWAAYYKASDAAILVVDCTDRARVGIARGELVSLLADDHLADAPLLVFANKQDARDAMRPPELTAALALHAVQRHDWHVQGCCALSGEGLEDGLRWLADAVRKKGGGAASGAAAAAAASPGKGAPGETTAAVAPAPATPAAAAVGATETAA